MTTAASARWGILKTEHVTVIDASDDTVKSGAHLVRSLLQQDRAGASRVDQADVASFGDG